MCVRVCASALWAAVAAVFGVAGSWAGRVGLAAAALAIAVWLWPVVVGVGGGVLAGGVVMAYVLGASRERPLWARDAQRRTYVSPHVRTYAPVEAHRDSERVAELERQLEQTQALARRAVRELHAAREDVRSAGRGAEDGRVLVGRVWRGREVRR